MNSQYNRKLRTLKCSWLSEHANVIMCNLFFNLLFGYPHCFLYARVCLCLLPHCFLYARVCLCLLPHCFLYACVCLCLLPHCFLYACVPVSVTPLLSVCPVCLCLLSPLLSVHPCACVCVSVSVGLWWGGGGCVRNATLCFCRFYVYLTVDLVKCSVLTFVSETLPYRRDCYY